MARYAAFLRGANVGGVNLTMTDLASALSAAGFGSVRTVLASGNVLLEAPHGMHDSAAAVRDRVETALRQRFGHEAWALVYDVSTVRSIAEGYPFPEAADRHSYVTFVGDPAVLDESAALAPPRRIAGADRPRRRGALLPGARVGHAGLHDRQDDGPQALHVVDHHPQPAQSGQGVARGPVKA